MADSSKCIECISILSFIGNPEWDTHCTIYSPCHVCAERSNTGHSIATARASLELELKQICCMHVLNGGRDATLTMVIKYVKVND